MNRFSLFLACCFTLAACPKKAPVEEGPKLGWISVGGIHCYAPPDFAAENNEIRRSVLRQEAWDALRNAFETGEPDPSVLVEARKLRALDQVLMAYPARIEGFASDAYKRCVSAGESGSVDSYLSWLGKSGKRLSVNDCTEPLNYELHDFFNIQTGWHMRQHMCKGDKILIELTPGDRLYTVFDTGDPKKNIYQGILGMVEQPPVEGAPCQECLAGAVLLRFEADAGGDTIIPFIAVDDPSTLADVYSAQEAQGNFSVEYQAAEHGFLSFSVNDDTFYDNTWYENVKRGFVEYIALDIYPATDEEDNFFDTP